MYLTLYVYNMQRLRAELALNLALYKCQNNNNNNNNNNTKN